VGPVANSLPPHGAADGGGLPDGGPLQIRSLSKSFEGQQALRKVDFDLKPGEVHALVGQNGSGKSTLVKVLAGFERPDRGASAKIGDQPFDLGDAVAARSARLCFVHQDLGLIEAMSVAENIALSLGYETSHGRINWRAEARRAGQALAHVGSSIDIRAAVGDLRPVDRTTVAIARALAAADAGGRFLILDEPTAALPRVECNRLFELIARLRTRGMGVMFIAHNLDEVLEVADRVTVLRDGQKVVTESVATLDRDRLTSLIVGRDIESALPERETEPGAGEDARLTVRDLAGASLRGVSFWIGSGEIVGVAGLVGSGREELTALISGAAKHWGEVRVGGRVVPAGAPAAAIAAGVASVPADRADTGLVSEMTVGENLTLADLSPFWKGGLLRRSSEREEIARWITRLNVQPPRPEVPIHALSGGNQQKVLLAKWLRLDPAVLVLDEPTQGVDVGAKRDIYAAVTEAAAGGAAVLVSSSDADELAALCDRVLVLRGGVIRRELMGPLSASQIDELSL
jgi:ribose transport system ATP-binding protein